MIICMCLTERAAYLCTLYYLLDKRSLRPLLFTALDDTTVRRIRSA